MSVERSEVFAERLRGMLNQQQAESDEAQRLRDARSAEQEAAQREEFHRAQAFIERLQNDIEVFLDFTKKGSVPLSTFADPYPKAYNRYTDKPPVLDPRVADYTKIIRKFAFWAGSPTRVYEISGWDIGDFPVDHETEGEGSPAHDIKIGLVLLPNGMILKDRRFPTDFSINLIEGYDFDGAIRYTEIGPEYFKTTFIEYKHSRRGLDHDFPVAKVGIDNSTVMGIEFKMAEILGSADVI